MGDPIMIDAHDIRFSYDGPGGRRSLNGAQLHVAPGEFVAVLGHHLHTQQHKTVIMITHYIEEAIGADRVYLIHNGKMIADGTAREMLTQPELLAAAGLTPPMPVQMYYDLKQAGIVLARCPLTLEELAEELCRSQ